MLANQSNWGEGRILYFPLFVWVGVDSRFLRYSVNVPDSRLDQEHTFFHYFNTILKI